MSLKSHTNSSQYPIQHTVTYPTTEQYTHKDDHILPWPNGLIGMCKYNGPPMYWVISVPIMSYLKNL